MENGAFALKEQMLHFPVQYFQIHDISRVLLWSEGLTVLIDSSFWFLYYRPAFVQKANLHLN